MCLSYRFLRARPGGDGTCTHTGCCSRNFVTRALIRNHLKQASVTLTSDDMIASLVNRIRVKWGARLFSCMLKFATADPFCKISVF
jgi:hypothetical protein